MIDSADASGDVGCIDVIAVDDSWVCSSSTFPLQRVHAHCFLDVNDTHDITPISTQGATTPYAPRERFLLFERHRELSSIMRVTRQAHGDPPSLPSMANGL